MIDDKDFTKYTHSIYGESEKKTTFYSEINSKVLSKIIVNQSYEIDFLYNSYRKDIKGVIQSTAPKSLDVIKIKYINEIETYNFSYGYFGINENNYNLNNFEGIAYNEDTSYRLKLKSFQKTGENPYTFSYYNESPVEKYTTCTDHWGYLSDSCGRYTMSPSAVDSYPTKKNPNLLACQSNILKNITIPTKGELEFTYELNDCLDCNISYSEYYWDTARVYSNTDDFFSNQWQSNEFFFTVPLDYVATQITFNILEGVEQTTNNTCVISLYDDQNQSVNFRAIGSGGQTQPYNGDPLVRGRTYRLVLECNDNIENENKYFGFNFLRTFNNTSLNNLVGGLRIKNIKTNNLNGVINNRSFEYKIDGESSGVLYEKPTYFDEYAYFVEANSPVGGLFAYGVQYSKLPFDLFGYNGHHIFYKKVTETNNDLTNSINDIKTEKYFTFFDDLRYGDGTYFSKLSYNWKRGLISQINEFKNNTNIRKTLFSYRFLDTQAGVPVSSLEPGNHISNPTFPNEFHRRSLYIKHWRGTATDWYKIYHYKSSKLISAWYYMDKKTTEENFNGSILTTEVNYKYENPISAQLTSQTMMNSSGENVEMKFYYPDDLLTEPFMTELKTANRIGMPIVTEKYKKGVLTFKSKIIFANDATTNNLLLPKNIYAAKFPNALPSLSNNIGQLEKKVIYNQYDDKGNIQQYTPESIIPVSIIWGYNKTQPIAKIENATYTNIPQTTIDNLQSLSNTGTEANLLIALATLRTSLSNAMVTTYTYKPLIGLSTMTDPKGYKMSYEYDAFNRLKQVKDQEGNIISENQYNYKQ